MGKKFLGLGGTDHFWDRAKAWILNQITSAEAAKIAEVVANAPEDLDTLKEIADWIKAHANDAAAMNTQITENKNNIASLSDGASAMNTQIQTNKNNIAAMNTQITENKNNIASLSDGASAMNTQIQTNKNNIAALQTSVAGKADKAHTHSTGDITSGTLPIANGGTGVTTQADINKAFIGNLGIGNDNVTDGTEFVSSWASDNGFAETTGGALNTPYKRQFIKVWNYIKGKISSVLGLTKDNYGGKAAKSSFLDEYVGAGGTRPTSGNIKPKDASEYGGMRKDVVTSSMTDSGRPNKDGHLLTMFWDNVGRYDNQFFVSNDNLPTVKVRAKGNQTDYGPWVDIITSNNIGSQTVANAGTADNARNMYYQNLDLSALDKTKFYPLVCRATQHFAEVAICSESGMGSMDYNQNRIHFDISTQGWNDLPPTLNIREYACYQNNEITIGCIGRGFHSGAWAIWLRGGLHYTCFSRDSDLSLHTSNYTYGDEVYTIGTNYYGGSNTNVSIMFTPQSTIKDGAYSSRPITASVIKASSKMVIPIGAPSSLEDGCIWIER